MFTRVLRMLFTEIIEKRRKKLVSSFLCVSFFFFLLHFISIESLLPFGNPSVSILSYLLRQSLFVRHAYFANGTEHHLAHRKQRVSFTVWWGDDSRFILCADEMRIGTNEMAIKNVYGIFSHWCVYLHFYFVISVYSPNSEKFNSTWLKCRLKRKAIRNNIYISHTNAKSVMEKDKRTNQVGKKKRIKIIIIIIIAQQKR